MLHQFHISKAEVEYKLYKEGLEALSSYHKYSKLEIQIYCVLYVGSRIFGDDIIAQGTSDDMLYK